METAIWLILLATVWFGIAITRELRSISKEAETIRKFLQKDNELKLISIPAHALNALEQLTEKVLQDAAPSDRDRSI